MLIQWIRRPALVGLFSIATLAAAVAGCGGQSDSSTAVVVPQPSALTTKAPTVAEATPAAGTAAPSTAAWRGLDCSRQGRRLGHAQGPGRLRR